MIVTSVSPAKARGYRLGSRVTRGRQPLAARGLGAAASVFWPRMDAGGRIFKERTAGAQRFALAYSIHMYRYGSRGFWGHWGNLSSPRTLCGDGGCARVEARNSRSRQKLPRGATQTRSQRGREGRWRTQRRRSRADLPLLVSSRPLHSSANRSSRAVSPAASGVAWRAWCGLSPVATSCDSSTAAGTSFGGLAGAAASDALVAVVRL